MGQGNHGASSRGKWTSPNTLKRTQAWAGSESFLQGIYRHCNAFLSWGGFPFKTFHLMWMCSFCASGHGEGIFPYVSDKNPECVLIAILQTQKALEAVSLPRMVPDIWNEFTFSQLRMLMYKTRMPLHDVTLEIQQYDPCAHMSCD